MVHKCPEAALEAEYEFSARSWPAELRTDAADNSAQIVQQGCIFLAAELDETWRN